jgi:hypothetical protein
MALMGIGWLKGRAAPTALRAVIREANDPSGSRPSKWIIIIVLDPGIPGNSSYTSAKPRDRWKDLAIYACLLISPQLGCFQHLAFSLPRLLLVHHTLP